MGQPSDTVGQPSDTVGQPSDTVGQPSDTVGQPSDTVGQPSDTVGQPSDTVGAARNAQSGSLKFKGLVKKFNFWSGRLRWPDAVTLFNYACTLTPI